MKRALLSRFIVSLMFVLSMMFMMTPLSMASTYHASQHKIPNTGICSGGCEGTAIWSGTTYGAVSTFLVPSYTGSSTNVLERDVAYKVNVSGNLLWFAVGYCFGDITSSFFPECKSADSGKYFADFCGTASGSCSLEFSATIPASDKGHTAQFGFTDDGSSSGSDVDIIINDENSGTTCDWDNGPGTQCTASGDSLGGADVMYLDNFTEGSFTGTRQGTFDYIFNQWVSSSLTVNDQSSEPSYTGNTTESLPASTNGAQLEHNTTPNGEGNEGGTITGCNIDNSKTTCA